MSAINANDTTILSNDISYDANAIAHVCLPIFWQDSSGHLFVHADAGFTKHRVTADVTRVNHILAALNEYGIRMIVYVFGPNASHSTEIDMYDIPRSTRFRAIVQSNGIDDRRPSQLLCDMRNVLP